MTVEVLAVDHVLLLMPPGPEAETVARRFYSSVLGLREVPKPDALARRGGLWFAGGAAAIHLGIDRTFAPAGRSHPALVVGDLAVARRALAASGVAVTDDDSGLDVRRCYVDDPFGNRIELVDAADAGFTNRGSTPSGE